MTDKLDQLLAIEAIRQLKSRYFRCMDTKDWAGVRAVFADDAAFDARASLSLDGAGEAGQAAQSNDWVVHGGDAIVEFIKGAAGPLQTVHHGHGHEIEVLSATEARGVIAMEDQIWDTATGAVFLHGCGHYHETYRRGADGWRIHTSRLSRLYVALGTA
jgi:hypothetical protein